MQTAELHQRRFEAAAVTHGTSGWPIYNCILTEARRINLKGDLLEYGAGAAALAQEILRVGFDVRITCADILPPPAGLPEDISWIQADLNNALLLPDGSFDVIVSSEVIEHLENPRATFREFYRLLRPNGTLLVTTPNQESIRSLCGLLMGGHFVAFLGASYPAHITALVRLDFERICGETGLAPPKFAYTNIGGIPKLPNINWQSLSFGLLKGRLFSDNLLVVTHRAPSPQPDLPPDRRH